MKVKAKSFMISVLMLFAFVFGVFAFMPTTTMASAAGGDGLTEATAKVVTNYAEFESAMEDSSIVYVKIDSNIDSAIQKSGSGIDVGAMVAGKKVLIVNATAEFYAHADAQAIDSLLYVQDGDDLTIKGDGTLRFVPNANATFNSVVRIDGGTVTVSGNVTIEGYTGAENYANAITNYGGNLNLLKGTCKGTLRVDIDQTNNFAVVDLQGGNTVINNIAVSATVSHDGLNESKASAMRIKASVNSAVIQGGTFEKVNNYSIAVDSSKVIADYVYSGIKMYDASTHTEVSDYDEIYTTARNVYFANAPQNAITSLALGTNKIVDGTKVSDLALTTYDTEKCTLGTYFVMNGLNKGLGDTGNAFLNTDTLNPQTDCSAIYSIYAKDGITFAPDFSAEDITFTNGVVTSVSNYGNAINVFVNFPKQTPEEPDESVITSLTLGTNKIVSGTKVSDLALTTYDTDKCTLGTYFVMNGLNKGLGDTGNAFLSTDSLNPEYDCSAIYSIYAKAGFTFDSNFSAEDITFTNGVVTSVGNYGNVVNVFVNFPKQEPETPDTVMVVYGPGEGDGSTKIDYITPDTTVTLLNPTDPDLGYEAPEGKKFAHWRVCEEDAQDPDAVVKNPGDEITITLETYIIAVWEDIPTVMVVYGPGEGDGSNEIDYVTPGTTVTLLTPTDLGYEAPEGKKFAHWRVCEEDAQDPDAVVKNPGDEITITLETYIIAVWEDIPHECSGVLERGQGATCTVDGWNDYYTCSCGKYYSDSACNNEIADLAAWKNGDGKIPAAHTFASDAWNEEIPATCVATGTKAHKDCTVCHKHFEADGVTEIADLTIAVDTNNHDMATEWTGVADGHYHVCKRVGCEYHDTLVGHSSSGAATEQNAETCTVCQYIITPALGHTTCSGGIKQNGQAATCTVNGWNDYYKCSGCEKLYEDAACTILISDLATWKDGDGKIAASHTYGDLIAKVDATCSATGMQAHFECSVCHTLFDADKAVKTENELTIAIDANAHTYGAWTSNGDGTHTRVCTLNAEHKENGECAGGTATCTEKAVCATCNTAYGNTAAHSHGSAWEKDESGHWNECVCGDKANEGAHVDQNTDGTCDTCGWVDPNFTPVVPGPGEGGQGGSTPDNTPDNTPEVEGEDEAGLSGGAIAGIAVGATVGAVGLGVGGFAIFWFVIKKKSMAELLAIFKKK